MLDKERAEYWRKLRELASDDKVCEFFQLYTEYLEKENCISNNRIALYKMAKHVVKYLTARS